MSDQPPPPPGGAPPPPPYQPPGPPPGHGQYPYEPPGGGMSNKAKFWFGVLLAIPAAILASVVTGVAGAIGASIDPTNGTATGLFLSLASLLELAALVAGIVWSRTRWWALGVLAGLAILLVLAAGACVVLIAALSGSSA